MRDLKREFNTAIIIITHDLGVIAGLSDRVMVMYAGNIVETGSVRDIFYDPQHPYTEGLLKSMPRLDDDTRQELPTIPGQPPNLQHLPTGRSEEHTSELQSLMRNSYAVFCLKKKNINQHNPEK